MFITSSITSCSELPKDLGYKIWDIDYIPNQFGLWFCIGQTWMSPRRYWVAFKNRLNSN